MTVSGTVGRRGLPASTIPMIIGFVGQFGLGAPGDATSRTTAYGSFTGGLQGTFVRTEWAGRTNGVQVDLTPLGAHLFLGVPMSALTNRLVPLDDVLGPDGPRLADRLSGAPCWQCRFEILDSFIGTRVAAAWPPSRAVTWAWRRISAAGGNVDVGALATDTGYSRKHLIGLVHRHIGLAPKATGRILRFERAVRLVETGELPFAEIANRCGYYDQAHLNRDFRRLAGSSPGEHLRLRSAEPDVLAGATTEEPRGDG